MKDLLMCVHFVVKTLRLRKHCCGNNVSCYVSRGGLIGKHMFQTQNLCPGSKNVFDPIAQTFFVSEQQNLFPQ